MKKIFWNIAFIIFILSGLNCFSQEITKENFQKAGNKIFSDYKEKIIKVQMDINKFPDKSDSLANAKDIITNEMKNNYKELAVKYASISSGLELLYSLRLKFTKDSLINILNSLPIELKESAYGKSLLKHTQNEQIKEGGKIYDFKTIDTNGNDFYLSKIKNNRILLVCGGLECMGENGRKALKEINKSSLKNNLSVVVYVFAKNIDDLKFTKNKYNLNCILISDFLNEHSCIKTIYGVQTTPTCFFINEDKTVLLKTEGLDFNKINNLIQYK